MAKRIRLVDIAGKLNLTKVSVSKALRNHPDISRETRDRVQQAAAEMGYTPNLLARSLSSQRSFTLGVVVPKIAHTFFSSVIDAIQEEATNRGYGIVLAVSNEQAELESRHIERLLAMHVDGLLVSVSEEAPDLDIYRRVRDLNVPLVFFDRRIQGLGFSSVTVDDRAGARRAVERMVDKGYRRIAYVGGKTEVAIEQERYAGYEEALRRHDIPLRPEWVVRGGFDERSGYRAFLQLLRSGDVPDVLFAVTYPVGLGLRTAIRHHAPELLDRIEIVSFGSGLSDFYTYPHLCVSQPTRALGRTSLQLLLDEIEAEDRGEPRNVVLKTELITQDDYPVFPLDGEEDEGEVPRAS